MDLPEHLKTKNIGQAVFHFEVMIGRVAAEKKWSETRIWGGGGGGHVGRRGGHLAPVHIRSAVDLNQEIWLELLDSTPHCLQLANMNVQALEGHPLSVVWVRAGAVRQLRVGSVCNLATGAQFDDQASCLYLAKTSPSSPLARPALIVLALLVAAGIIWGGLYLLGFLSLFPGLALANKIADGRIEEDAHQVRRHMAEIHMWIADELTWTATADGATVIDGDAPTGPGNATVRGEIVRHS